jgi:hypothetical protein
MRAWDWRCGLAATAAAAIGLLVGAVAFAGEPPSSGGSGGATPHTGVGYPYQLFWKGSHYAAGFSKQSPVLVPGTPKSLPIDLQNGSLGDPAFATWAEATSKAHSGAGMLKDIRLEVWDKSGVLKSSHTYKDCWASLYASTLPISYKGSGVPVQELMLQCAEKA